MRETTSDIFINLIDRIHKHIYANEGLSSQQAFEEVIKLLYVKIFDEQNKLDFFFVSGREKERAATKGVCPSFETRINDLFNETKRGFADVFYREERIKLNTNTLANAVEILSGTTVSTGVKDAGGILFQRFITRKHRSERGQFFTPEIVVKMAIDILSPNPEERLIDPACGSGGFLICATEHIENKFPNTDIKGYINKQITGIEINPSISRVAKLSLMLCGGNGKNIISGDALDKNSGYANGGTFDIVITNPPFGAEGMVTNRNLLAQYKLGSRADGSKPSKKQAPEILFIERCIGLINKSGRAGIILPNGILENKKYAFVRKYINENIGLTGLIALPEATFIPYGTGVKTSLLILNKRDKWNRVFFGKVTKIGYEGSRKGRTVYKKNKSGKKVIDQDTEAVAGDFHYFSKHGTIHEKKSYVLGRGEITDRFDYQFNRPKYGVNMLVIKNSNHLTFSQAAQFAERKKLKLKGGIRYKYIEVSDINSDYYEIASYKTYTKDKLPKRASFRLKKGDIIIALSGTNIGTKKQGVAMVDSGNSGALCSSGFCVVRGFGINPLYLLYYIGSKDFTEQVARFKRGSTIPGISEEDVKQILIRIPNERDIRLVAEKVDALIKARNKLKKFRRRLYS